MIGLPLNISQYYKTNIRYLQTVCLLKPITSKQCSIPSPVLSLLTALLHQKSKGTRALHNLFTNNNIFSKTPIIL